METFVPPVLGKETRSAQHLSCAAPPPFPAQRKFKRKLIAPYKGSERFERVISR